MICSPVSPIIATDQGIKRSVITEPVASLLLEIVIALSLGNDLAGLQYLWATGKKANTKSSKVEGICSRKEFHLIRLLCSVPALRDRTLLVSSSLPLLLPACKLKAGLWVDSQLARDQYTHKMVKYRTMLLRKWQCTMDDLCASIFSM